MLRHIFEELDHHASVSEPIARNCYDIELDNIHLPIVKNLSLNAVGEMLHSLHEKIPGITYPYGFVGEKHSLSAWRVEEGALWSVTYNHIGAMKVWMIIPPSSFGVANHLASLMGFVSACASVKPQRIMFFNPQFFKDIIDLPFSLVSMFCSCVKYVLFIYSSGTHNLFIWYSSDTVLISQVVQPAGYAMITWPWALRSGFDAGFNVASATCFMDHFWIHVAPYVAQCTGLLVLLHCISLFLCSIMCGGFHNVLIAVAAP